MMDRRVWRKAGPFALALLLVVLGISPAWAEEPTFPSLQDVESLKHDALSSLGSILTDPQSNDTNRLSAVNALVQSGDREALPLLVAALLNDPAAFVRRAAAEGLAGFGGFAPLHSPQAAAALREAALTDPIASVRWAAGASLVQWSLTERGIIEHLLSDPETLAAAAISLQEAANAQSFPRALWPLLQSAFINAFAERATYDVVERAAMLKALAQLGARDAIPLLRQTLAAPSDDPFVRGAAAFALGLLNATAAVPDLITALQSDQDAVQLAAAGALGDLKDLRALEPLIQLLHTAKSEEVRAAAASALAPFGAAAVPVLAPALQSDPSPTVRQAALDGLVQIGGSEATEAVLIFLQGGYLQSCDPSTCGGLALDTLAALVQLGQGPLALQALTDALTKLGDALPFLYIFAEQQLVQVISAVGRVAPQTFDLLLNNESPFAQALGLEALSSVQCGAARPTLMRYVGPDENSLVRRAALEGLARWPTLAEMPLFTQFVADRDPRTRKAVLSALAHVGDVEALAPLRSALGSATVAIRLDAAGASLVYANRMVLLNELLNCNPSALPRSDRIGICFVG